RCCLCCPTRFNGYLFGKLQGIIPESVKFHQVSRSGNDRLSLNLCIHPADSLVATVSGQQSLLLVTDQIRMPSPGNICNDLEEEISVFFCECGFVFPPVLLQRPDNP